MEALKGFNIAALPIDTDQLSKVSDLMEYEGPILSHFVDKKGSNYLYYWVDFNENYNRWLIWKVTEHQLYNYLKGQFSLKELMLSENKDFIYSVEIDKDFKFNNIKAVDFGDLQVAYIPEEESYYNYPIPSIYDELIKKIESNPYLQHLRESALYFKLTPSNLKFDTSITAIDASIFLKNISESFLNYAQYDFFEKFKSQFGDLKKLNKIITQFKEILKPRIVETGYSSFKVGLSSDTVNSVEGSAYKEWQRALITNYQHDVIDVDYTSDTDIELITEKFPDSAIRKEIFEPIIDIINDKRYQTEVVNYKRTLKRKYISISKVKKESLLPPPEVLMQSDHAENKKFITIVIEVNESQDLTNLGKRAIQENTLFTQERDTAEIEYDKINSGGYFLKLNKPLKCNLTIKEHEYKLECLKPPVLAVSENREDVFEKFRISLVSFFIGLMDLKDNNDLTLENLEYLQMVKELSVENPPATS